jgi:hypothetical protein
MSRARSVRFNGDEYWFDTNLDHRKASSEQLELLAAVEDISMDDLLDEGLNQGQVILRLREALDGPVVPPEVLERKRQRKIAAQKQPECRICGEVGKSTRHHFIPRWLMRELENYHAYSTRSICTIPLCVECHRDIHMRDGELGKSMVPYLSDQERALAQRMLDDLKEQRPRLFELIAGGSDRVYEGQLLHDYHAGLFRVASLPQKLEETRGLVESL